VLQVDFTDQGWKQEQRKLLEQAESMYHFELPHEQRLVGMRPILSFEQYDPEGQARKLYDYGLWEPWSHENLRQFYGMHAANKLALVAYRHMLFEGTIVVLDDEHLVYRNLQFDWLTICETCFPEVYPYQRSHARTILIKSNVLGYLPPARRGRRHKYGNDTVEFHRLLKLNHPDVVTAIINTTELPASATARGLVNGYTAREAEVLYDLITCINNPYRKSLTTIFSDAIMAPSMGYNFYRRHIAEGLLIPGPRYQKQTNGKQHWDTPMAFGTKVTEERLLEIQEAIQEFVDEKFDIMEYSIFRDNGAHTND
jgi:hypothetical protein